MAITWRRCVKVEYASIALVASVGGGVGSAAGGELSEEMDMGWDCWSTRGEV